MPLQPGTRLGPYVIEGRLGAGGMGDVYKARDSRLDRTVAIKTIASDLIGDPDRRHRFDREARAIAALSHPNICAIFDVGQDGGLADLVMEYLDGETLAERLAAAGRPASTHSGGAGAAQSDGHPPPARPLPVRETLGIAVQLAHALAAAHKAGIVHRDLKPANIVLLRSGSTPHGAAQVKVLDFGLARLAGSTPEPEPLAMAAPLTAPVRQQRGGTGGARHRHGNRPTARARHGPAATIPSRRQAVHVFLEAGARETRQSRRPLRREPGCTRRPAPRAPEAIVCRVRRGPPAVRRGRDAVRAAIRSLARRSLGFRGAGGGRREVLPPEWQRRLPGGRRHHRIQHAVPGRQPGLGRSPRRGHRQARRSRTVPRTTDVAGRPARRLRARRSPPVHRRRLAPGSGPAHDRQADERRVVRGQPAVVARRPADRVLVGPGRSPGHLRAEHRRKRAAAPALFDAGRRRRDRLAPRRSAACPERPQARDCPSGRHDRREHQGSSVGERVRLRLARWTMDRADRAGSRGVADLRAAARPAGAARHGRAGRRREAAVVARRPVAVLHVRPAAAAVRGTHRRHVLERPPVALFRLERDIRDFDVSPDGQRVLISFAPSADFTPYRLLVNWRATLAGG